MDKSVALELYKLFRQENSTWLNNHREHSRQYFTLVAAILAASIAAVSQFSNDPLLLLIVLIGPLINILLCAIAIRLCNRSYQAYLEGITVQAKLEPVIGLIGQRPKVAMVDKIAQFPQDKNIIPERWLENRLFPTARDFVIAGMNKGSNNIIRLTFRLLAVFNILFGVVIVIFVLKLLGII